MDKQIAARTYDVGWRAYIDFDGVKFFSNINTPRELEAKTFAGQHPESIEHWRYLRAYQDEQRKKGVPIVMSDSEALQFSRLCLRSETQFNYVHAYTCRPGIQSITPLKPYGQRVNGRFTNFRWREGYPKQVASPHDNAGKCCNRCFNGAGGGSVAYCAQYGCQAPALPGWQFEKGGQNG